MEKPRHDILIPTASKNHLTYCETDFHDFTEYPCRTEGGLYFAVISGTATLYNGMEEIRLVPQTEVSFITESVFQCINPSEDFRVRVFVYSRELFLKISMPIDNIFFEYNEEHPVYVHTPDVRSQRTWRELLQWMDICRTLFSRESKPRFRTMQEENFLQGFWMWNFGTIQDRIDTQQTFSNTHQIAHRFIRLVKEEVAAHHQAEYYAVRLNISQRYLNKIIWRHTRGRTPKQMIDAQLTAVIKSLLADPTLSLSEIALRLSFPDQSYFSRFFRRNTSMSPSDYRASISRHWKFN